MRWFDVVDPVPALGQCILGRVIVGGKVVNEAHDACCAGAALAAGHGNLRGKTAAG